MAPNDLTLDDDLDDKPARKSKPIPTRTEYLGDLHVMLTKGLPDLVDDQGVLNVKRLSERLGISFQAVYKFFKNDKIPAKRIPMIIALSKAQKTGGKDFKPLVRDDLLRFLFQS